MNPTAQNIEIAKVLGAFGPFTSLALWPTTCYERLHALKCNPNGSTELPGSLLALIPDFLNDLNAMHWAEEFLINGKTTTSATSIPACWKKF